MEPTGTTTRHGLGGEHALAPDTIRDGTAPLAAPQRVSTSPMTAVSAVRTVPLARAAKPAARLTYDVYTPDDTLRGARALTVADAARATRQKQQRFGLGALALAVTLSTTLMAIGSCDDATGRVETTAAVATATAKPATTASVTATTAKTVAPEEVIPPIVFSPPLSPPPRRRATKR